VRAAAGVHGTPQPTAATAAAAARQPAGQAAAAARQRRGPGLLGFPIKVLTAGINLMASVVHMTFSIAALVGDRVLPAAVMRSARGRSMMMCMQLEKSDSCHHQLSLNDFSVPAGLDCCS
jgi:hypothetical protein